MISEEELALIRAEQLKLLPEQVIVRRPVLLDGGEIGKQTIYAKLPARVKAGAGKFRIIADRYQGIVPYVITVPYGSDVKSNDEIVDQAGNLYHIRSTTNPQSFHTAMQMLADGVH